MYLNVENLDNDIQGWDKKFVTHDGEGHEHVDDPDDVEDDGPFPSLLKNGNVYNLCKRDVYKGNGCIWVKNAFHLFEGEEVGREEFAPTFVCPIYHIFITLL